MVITPEVLEINMGFLRGLLCCIALFVTLLLIGRSYRAKQ